MTDQRILFMGTAQFAVPSLAKLLSLKKNIINVYSSPPKKANRGPFAEFKFIAPDLPGL